MKGSVRKRGKKWSYRVEFGRENGKRTQIERGGFNTKKEAEKAMADTLYELNNHGEMIENIKISFYDVYNEFIETEAKATRAYVDLNGELVIEPQFDSARNFHHGVAVVIVDGKYGVIDKSGKFIIEPQYEYLGDCGNGLLSVWARDSSESAVTLK